VQKRERGGAIHLASLATNVDNRPGNFSPSVYGYRIMLRAITPLAAAWLLLTLVGGCGGQQQTLDQVIDDASRLPGVSRSQHSQLRALLRDIELAGGLPTDVSRPEEPAGSNAATLLLNALAPGDDFDTTSDATADLLAQLPTTPLADWYRQAGKFVDDHRKLLDRVRAASLQPACQFDYHFAHGYFNDTHFIDAAATACRLQLVASALATQTSALAPAIDEWILAWQWTRWLDTLPLVDARLQAAVLRAEALTVLSLIATDQRTTPRDLVQLAAALQGALATWPAEGDMLVAERALVMHAYEMVRQGLLDLVVTSAESKLLREEKVWYPLKEADATRIDDDQFHYLNYMVGVIALAERPYHLRVSELRELDRQLGVTADGRYPWLAKRVFADGLTKAQADLARSQTELLGWLVALRAAAGQPLPSPPASPLTGEAITVEAVGNRAIARLNDRSLADPSVRVPTAPPAN
jgi:hypothetical protein